MQTAGEEPPLAGQTQGSGERRAVGRCLSTLTLAKKRDAKIRSNPRQHWAVLQPAGEAQLDTAVPGASHL